MNRITNVIVHCSDSEWGCCRAIREWHLERGWRDIGYHFGIMNGYPTYEDFKNNNRFKVLDGQIECGRYLNGNLIMKRGEIGAHCLGYNEDSVGVYLIGKNKFTFSQKSSLVLLCRELAEKYQLEVKNIIGHNETESGIRQGKTCPNLDMSNIRSLIKNISGVA